MKWYKRIGRTAQYEHLDLDEDCFELARPLLDRGVVEEDPYESCTFTILGIPEEFGTWEIQYSESDTGRGFSMAEWDVIQNPLEGTGSIWQTFSDIEPAYEWAIKNYKDPEGTGPKQPPQQPAAEPAPECKCDMRQVMLQGHDPDCPFCDAKIQKPILSFRRPA